MKLNLTPKFICRIERGKLLMEGIVKDIYESYLKSLPSDEYFVLVKRKTKEPSARSVQQNKYLWAIYDIISDHTGHTDEEVHEIFKVMFLSRPVEIAGKELMVPLSTTKLNTIEFEDYCESIRRFCSSNLSLSIPEPNEAHTDD